MKVAGVGFCCVDVYEKLGKCYPTGNGIDFVIHLSRFGIQTTVVSVVGNDPYGTMMVDTLCKEGIDTSRLRVAEGETAVFKMDLNENDRVHGELIEGVMKHFYLNEEDLTFIQEHDYLHTDLFGKIIDLLPLFRKKGVSIIFDFSRFLENKDVDFILPHVDYAFFSYERHDSYIIAYMKWAKRFGPKIVTVTLGQNGSLAYDGENMYRQDIVPVQVINTVGAGDSFIAGFMYGVMNNHDKCTYAPYFLRRYL
ncbi:fructoselysine 6-kinase [Paenibacillus alginolyticus]|uniref:Fructoselysine 6-kinase n=1 Tax=Paenibacillus alginolyticus TaxID=59839 RepID=A0ABT4GAL5_9BACL|nr:fructoselysine 6-kinase [Paenibacillus alginolyticus]MCY9693221.1 fructoselysine 6-kinase [Paenibacillus alginolyticus]MEC0146010.1 fructoselysine 6-kinase [Paenibacillus alginolyticus]